MELHDDAVYKKRIAELEAKIQIRDRAIESLLHYCKSVPHQIAEEEIAYQRRAAKGIVTGEEIVFEGSEK